MDSIKEGISFPYCLVKKGDFAVGAVGLNNSCYFVDFAVELADIDKVGQLMIEKLAAHSESLSHVLDSHRFKRLQVLLISNKAHLFSIVVHMIAQVDISLDAFDYVNEGLEEFLVLARVKRLCKLL